MVITDGPIAGDRVPNGLQHVALDERLGQELDGSGLHRSHSGRNIAVARDEDNGDLIVRVGHPSLQIESAQIGQPHVQHQTARCIRARALQELLGRRKRFDLQPCGPNEAFQCLTHRRIVIHHEHDGLGFRHEGLPHTVNWNVVPGPSFGTAQSRPPCCSTIVPADREAHPHPAALRGVERLEHAVRELRVDAGSRVLHRDTDAIGRLPVAC